MGYIIIGKLLSQEYSSRYAADMKKKWEKASTCPVVEIRMD